MSFARKIKELRESHGLTQAEFGKIAGVSDKAVSTWENGTAEPRMGSIQKIADHFHISKGELLDDPYSVDYMLFSMDFAQVIEISRRLDPADQKHLLKYAEFLANARNSSQRPSQDSGEASEGPASSESGDNDTE